MFKNLMSTIPSLLMAFVLICQMPAALANDFEVVETQFHFEVQNADGSVKKHASTLVPNLPGYVCYVWGIRFAVSSDQQIVFRETFVLPAEPVIWSGEGTQDSPTTLSSDRKTAVTEFSAAMQNNWIRNGWCVVAGDPIGDYSIDVSLGDKSLHQFNFELLAVK